MPSRPVLPLVVESEAGSSPLPFRVQHVVCAGYSGRTAEERERHVRELGRIGIPPPPEAPVFSPVGSYLVTVDEAIEVQGPFTSGEAELVLLLGQDGPWVTVGSDHTDRFFERHSVAAAKQLCPKVLARTAWPLREVEPHWDELRLRAWVRSGRRRALYQDAALATVLPPPALLAGLRRQAGRLLDGVVLFCGTVPTVDGEVVYGDGYELLLEDPRRGRSLRTHYTVQVLDRPRR